MEMRFKDVFTIVEKLTKDDWLPRGIGEPQFRLSAGIIPSSMKRFIEENGDEVIRVQFFTPLIFLDNDEVSTNNCTMEFELKNKRFEYQVPFDSYDVIANALKITGEKENNFKW